MKVTTHRIFHKLKIFLRKRELLFWEYKRENREEIRYLFTDVSPLFPPFVKTDNENPQGEYWCSSHLSLTSALDGGGCLTPRPGHFTPGKETRYSLYRRLCRPKGRAARVQKISPQPAIDPQTFPPVASCYTYWNIPTHPNVPYKSTLALEFMSLLSSVFDFRTTRSQQNLAWTLCYCCPAQRHVPNFLPSITIIIGQTDKLLKLSMEFKSSTTLARREHYGRLGMSDFTQNARTQENRTTVCTYLPTVMLVPNPYILWIYWLRKVPPSVYTAFAPTNFTYNYKWLINNE